MTDTCMCELCVYLSVGTTEVDRETHLGRLLSQWLSGDWRDFLFYVSTKLPTPPTVSTMSFRFALDPQPTQILSRSSPRRSLSHSLLHHRYFLHPLLLPIIICLSAVLTRQLSRCFSAPFPFDFIVGFLLPITPSSSSFSSSCLLLLFFQSLFSLPKGEVWVWWTWRARNKSVYRSLDVSLALPLWSSAENKVFIKRNLPNLPLLPPNTSPLHYPPSLGNGEAVSGTCPPNWDLLCLPITFL